VRLVSVFRRGWIRLIVALIRQEPLPWGRFVPEPWPRAPDLPFRQLNRSLSPGNLDQWVVSVRNFEEICTGDSHLQDNDLLIELAHPLPGATTMYGMPVKLTRTAFTERKHAPLHGEHSREILQDLGYSEEKTEQVVRAGIVKTEDD
jgi:hypothetical protein